MTCDCQIRIDDDTDDAGAAYVVYCAMHRAAPAMLAALLLVSEKLAGRGQKWAFDALMAACAAIPKSAAR